MRLTVQKTQQRNMLLFFLDFSNIKKQVMQGKIKWLGKIRKEEK